MNISKLLYFLLFFGLTTPLLATEQEETITTQETSITKTSEESDDQNYQDELEKCKELKVKILGNRFDPKRVAVVAPLFIIDLAAVFTLTLKGTKNGMSLPIAVCCGLAYGLCNKKLYEMMLKKYECVPGTADLGVIGIPLYALFNKSVVCSNVKKILANYDSEEIPSCLKKQFDALAEEYQANNGILTMTNNELLEFIIEIVLPELNKFINPQVAEEATN